jgi:hypothetical protein
MMIRVDDGFWFLWLDEDYKFKTDKAKHCLDVPKATLLLSYAMGSMYPR